MRQMHIGKKLMPRNFTICARRGGTRPGNTENGKPQHGRRGRNGMRTPGGESVDAFMHRMAGRNARLPETAKRRHVFGGLLQQDQIGMIIAD